MLARVRYDVVLRRGLVFDGKGSPPDVADVAIRDGKIARIDRKGIAASDAERVIDCEGTWVMPGFVDLHTHYDAEIEVAPGLSESVRHGVTTILLGSCSLSLALGTPDDLAEMFCRVEAIPDFIVRPLLHRAKTWDGHRSYFAHLHDLALGPNVISFVGHSALRAHVLGMERSLEKVEPTTTELETMDRLLQEALDDGYLGMSVQTLPWDKVGGDREIRSRPLPSTFAPWSEVRRLGHVLRDRGRILQGVPNPAAKLTVFRFALESMGIFRRPLKTTLISMMDVRAARGLRHLASLLSRGVNLVLGGDMKWQALPEPFDLWADGIDLVVFEEFGAGAAALHLEDQTARAKLLRDPAYRERFRREWTNRFLPRAFHRDFNQSEIRACPDPSVVGKSFAEVARERGHDAVDTFLDLVALHGKKLRWYTVMANDRRPSLEQIVAHPDVLIGFSDAGAHLRQMAHYNFPLRMLRLVRQAAERGSPVMSIERAIHRLTGEIADWLDIEAGHLEKGARADVTVIDPNALGEEVDRAELQPMDFFDGYERLVRRNDAAVRHVFIGGHEAIADGKPKAGLGAVRFGSVLRSTSR
ncbi:amidohydrolase family protein [soil metagenome]